MSVTDGDRERAAAVVEKITDAPWDVFSDAEWGWVDAIAGALAEEREKARAPFLALLDVEPDIQPLWDFERGALRGIEMTKAAIRSAAEETE